MNCLYTILKRIATIFCLILITLPSARRLYGRSCTIKSETREISETHITYLYENISLPADMEVQILIYSYIPRSEKYIFDSEKNVSVIPQPAVLKLMITTVHNSSRKVKFFEKTGSTKEELIRLSIRAINDYLELISRQ